MNAIRIHKVVDSETLHLPELKPLIGKTVEIIVLEDAASSIPPAETMATFLAFAPPETPLTPRELDELRAAAKQDPALAAILDLHERGGLDVEAIVKLRAASTI